MGGGVFRWVCVGRAAARLVDLGLEVKVGDEVIDGHEEHEQPVGAVAHRAVHGRRLGNLLGGRRLAALLLGRWPVARALGGGRDVAVSHRLEDGRLSRAGESRACKGGAGGGHGGWCGGPPR
eukprot:880497-Prymnesium_polylepis.1